MTSLGRMAECRDCHDPIRFVKMIHTGRALPVDPTPNPRGTVAARLSAGKLVGFVISQDHRPGPLDSFRFLPHHASCQARKASKKPTPAPDPALF